MRCDMFFEKKKPYPERSYPIEQIPSTVPNEYQSAQIERKFGMFIHFGINTFNNTEWSNGKLPVASYGVFRKLFARKNRRRQGGF